MQESREAARLAALAEEDVTSEPETEHEETVNEDQNNNEEHPNIGGGDAGCAGRGYFLRDLDTGYCYKSQREFAANLPADDEVQTSLLHFFGINTTVIQRIIECGFQRYEQIPRPVDSHDYIKDRCNATFNKWLQLMKALGFNDFFVEIAKLQGYCKDRVEDFKVTDSVACACTDFLINEFLNFVQANKFWYTKGTRAFIK